jgi:hypothetical protein
MIHVKRVENEIQVNVALERRPALYLDQFALYHFARQEDDRERFFAAFEHVGELLFSSINLMEVGFLEGDSAKSVRDFLSRIGPHWVPIEFDPLKVAQAEIDHAAAQGTKANALSGSLLALLWDASGKNEDVTLAAAIDAFEREDRAAHKNELQIARDAMAQQVADWAKRYDAMPAEAKQAFVPIVGAGPTLQIATTVFRAVLDEAKGYKWMPNDAYDFTHAIVPLAYADAVFLDKQWKRRMERLTLPEGVARIFYGAETCEFLDWLESFK